MKILLLSVLFIILFYIFKKAHKNTTDVVINKVQINQKQTHGHDPILNILHLSDMHLENISISPVQLYEKLKDESIDLIALTGDFLDRKRTISKLAPYLEVLSQLHAKHGIYAVFGNHDYVLREKDLQKLKEILEQYGCKVMQNENHVIYVQNKRVNIIGVDDFSTKRSDLIASYRGVKSGTNLVLTHDPNIVLHMKEYHFHYLLAGHFHGGQICYPKAYHLAKMGKLARMNVIKGLHIQDGKPFYISEGLGQTGVNIRVGSRPEITLHQLSISTVKSSELPAV
ncbi:metallophosphoesterase [Bacillus sp. Xin]|uniref:metallophosphoesterase n=1 Tax=unclassified Bacillus (in: firmicutes) TaxID=185979 RepID=UPI001573AA2C|nr:MULTISPECIES: metallophosphoesterase [unclassified Bacillus (in: firmicutes)]MBC6972138.1 metallophosphoesterase [Bacillus sp. Xin]NSW36930.1 metallophosphoesterase [Bacillus sp. Xin1]